MLKMVLEKNFRVTAKPIANWWFEDRSKLISSVGVDELIHLLQMCEKTLVVLRSYGLLRPTTAILSKAWCHYNEKGEHCEAIQKTQLAIDLPYGGDNTLEDLILQTVVKEQVDNGFSCPYSIEISGNGVVIDNLGGEVICPDVIRINALLMEVPVVDVMTYNYAWLPYSLSGEPQAELYHNNAPRLENALKEIEKVLRVEGVTDSSSDYCDIDGYKLDNFRDCDGKPLAVGQYGGIL